MSIELTASPALAGAKSGSWLRAARERFTRAWSGYQDWRQRRATVRVLVPAGFCPEPHLAEAVLATVLGLGPDDLGVLTREGAEIVALSAFAPLTRAGVRRAMREEPA